jgi:hypothetical protein
VLVIGGTLAGTGSIGGSVTIGGGSGPATLALRTQPGKEATLTIQSILTFQTNGTYLYAFKANRNNSKADLIISNGVMITGGATVGIDGKIANRLTVGTTFTLISNTAGTPIAGTFANLPDASIITIDGTHFQASYGGGDGNDLTLTVVP